MSTNSAPKIFILSGGVGASGEQLVQTVLAQFPEQVVEVETIGHIRREDQITQALAQAKAVGGFVIHTMVDEHLRRQVCAEAERLQVPAADLMGDLMTWLTGRLGREPLQEPGKFRQLNRAYFERVQAIDFMMNHDDGKNPEGWSKAEVLLLGVSRTGKTPLSVYLAVLGWRTANYPLVPQIPIPDELFKLPPEKVIGLTMDPRQLLSYRQQRQTRLGVTSGSEYTDLDAIRDEMRSARRIYQQGGFETVDMTDKTIEMGADEIIRLRTAHSGKSLRSEV